jgi:hypothetical protein
MVRKLFIVAKGNDVTYASLIKAIGHEPNVEIFYDRRARPRRLRRWNRGRKRLVRKSRPERRASASIDDEIRRTGWAVVRRE